MKTDKQAECSAHRSRGTVGQNGPLHIAVLFHEVDGRRRFGHYGVHQLAALWEEDGHQVSFLYGTKRFVPADVLLLHVDVSVVPEDYLRFADRYPLVLNRNVTDIRKSGFSRQLLLPGSSFKGPVIIKTDRNYGGEPEEIREQPGLVSRAARRMRKWWKRKEDGVPSYPLFDSLSLVPAWYHRDPRWVVERFIPELDDEGLFCTRSYLFFGEAEDNYLLRGPSPIVNARTARHVESRAVPDAIREWKRRLGIDFGKLDYVFHEGQIALLDVNKTVGSAPESLSVERLHESRRRRANGLYTLVRDSEQTSAVPDSPDSSRNG